MQENSFGCINLISNDLRILMSLVEPDKHLKHFDWNHQFKMTEEKKVNEKGIYTFGRGCGEREQRRDNIHKSFLLLKEHKFIISSEGVKGFINLSP